jgi:hypothetical protein
MGAKKDDAEAARLAALAKAAREEDEDAMNAAVDEIRAAGDDKK